LVNTVNESDKIFRTHWAI